MFFGQQAQFNPNAVTQGLQETNSPVLASLIAMMSKKSNLVVLDLGPARAANLEILSRFHCKLFIEDAHEMIASFCGDTVADNAILESWLDQWTPAVKPGSIDVVLAWDIFNYLQPALYKTLVDRITPLLNPGAHLYLSVYSQKEMPALPMQFNIVADDRMEFMPVTRATRPSPRFNQADLNKNLRDFMVIKSVLLRNGLQEYLFKRTS